MPDLIPCPFCKNKELQRSQYSMGVAIMGGRAYTTIRDDPVGDYFEIRCDSCGCSLLKHQDELTEEYETYLDSLPESEREKFYEVHENGIGYAELWMMMEESWNHRE